MLEQKVIVVTDGAGLLGRQFCMAIATNGGILDNQPESFIEAYNINCGHKGILNAEDITGSLVFLLSDLSKHMTGQNLIVDDGFSL